MILFHWTKWGSTHFTKQPRGHTLTEHLVEANVTSDTQDLELFKTR
jgi:hypothetical protein